MSLGTPTTRLNNSRDVANVWITSGTTKLISLKSSSEYTVSTKTDIGLKPGVSTAKRKESTSTKSNPLYRYFVNIKNIFSASERCVQMDIMDKSTNPLRACSDFFKKSG